MKNKNHVITRTNRAECGAVCQNDRLSAGHIWQTRSHVYGEVKCQAEIRSDVVIPNELGNGETCRGLRRWRLLSNLKNNFLKPVRNDMISFLAPCETLVELTNEVELSETACRMAEWLGRGGNSLKNNATTCAPLVGEPKSLISKGGKNALDCNQKTSPEFVKNKLDCFAFARNDEKTVTNLFPYFPISKKLRRFRIKSGMTFIKQPAFTLAEGATHVDLSPTKVKFAFTLAEVLITLGIIGVVAAITIPGLMNNYKANKLRTQFLKTYSTVQQAFKFMQEDDVSLDPASYNRREGQVFYKTYKKYLKGITDCGLYTTEAFPCYNFQKEIYKTLNGKAVVDKFLFDDGQVVLQDGTLLAFEQPADGGNRIWVLADINGINNPPNRLGYDLFVFEFLDGELRTMGEKGTIFYNSNSSVYCSKTSTHPYNGMSCSFRAKSESEYFKWVVKNIK